MNILIESGATKSTCIGYNATCTFFTYKTVGINATYATQETIINIFKEIITQNNIDVEDVEDIRYYGAGCFNAQNTEKVQAALQNLFLNANISVFSDLNAACHALCKKEKGFVGILGTGSASCLYDGMKIIDRAPSLGYLLGDEGSGTYLGKMFVTAYLADKTDNELTRDFQETFKISKATVFEKVYQTSKPQIFFASIPVFLQKHLENNNIQKLIADAFQDFFDKQIDYYGKTNELWFFCGSIAYHFQDILIHVARKNDIEIKAIIQECATHLLHFLR